MTGTAHFCPQTQSHQQASSQVEGRTVVPIEKAKSTAPQGDKHVLPKLARAGPDVMHDAGGWDAVDIPVGPFDSHAPVDFFGVHEKPFIQETYLAYDLGASHHGCTERMVYGKRLTGLV
jgi:hypothetical protein